MHIKVNAFQNMQIAKALLQSLNAYHNLFSHVVQAFVRSLVGMHLLFILLKGKIGNGHYREPPSFTTGIPMEAS